MRQGHGPLSRVACLGHHTHIKRQGEIMLNNRRTATADTLNEEMDFDHVIYSHGDGTISDVDPGSSLRGPDVYTIEQEDGSWLDEDVEGPWELLNGFSGQHAYSGPIMHSSEYIGGGLARHILDTEGFYVTTCVTAVPNSDDLDDDYFDSDAWVVAYTEMADV